MSKHNVKIITSTFALSILSLLGIISTIIITFALNLSGFNLQVSASLCSKAYFVIKSSSLSTMLKVHTATGLMAVCLAIIILILVIQLYWPLRLRSSSSQQTIRQNRNKIIAIYLLASCECLCMVSNGAGNLSLLVDNDSCAFFNKSALIGLAITSVVALMAILAIWVLILVIFFSLTSAAEQISLRDLQRNSEISKEEEAMSRQLQKQMREYYSNNPLRKDQMMEGLLKAQQPIFPHKNDESTLNRPNSKKDGQAASNKPQQNIFEGDSPITAEKEDNNADQATKANNEQKDTNKQKKLAAQMHSYNHTAPAEDDGYYIPNPKEQQFDMIPEKKIDEQKLFVKEDDNLSEKFDENNFQLDYDLERAIRFEEEEDLSPLELRQLMHLTKASFILKSNNEKSLTLEKTYDEPQGFVARVNFVKIKQHKQHLKKQREMLEKQTDPDEYMQTSGKEEKKRSEELEEDRPITEETAKLLKTILFDNSEFYKKQPEKQGCPIAKYIENDDGFEVIQSNEKEGKHKRAEYAKEQLLFTKKRRDNSEDNQKEKGTVREEFNELEFIRMERKAIFGDEDGERFGKETSEGKRFGKLKKRKLVEVIRSKYYQ